MTAGSNNEAVNIVDVHWSLTVLGVSLLRSHFSLPTVVSLGELTFPGGSEVKASAWNVKIPW